MDIREDKEYQYDFKDKDVSVFKTRKGLNEDIIREISKHKGEPSWMLEYRLKSYREFISKPLPNFGPDLSEINFDEVNSKLNLLKEKSLSKLKRAIFDEVS